MYWQDPQDPNAADYYNNQSGYGNDPNQGGDGILGEQANQPGGGPQQTSTETQAVDQALQTGGGSGGGANSPVNPDGNINPGYGATSGEGQNDEGRPVEQERIIDPYQGTTITPDPGSGDWLASGPPPGTPPPRFDNNPPAKPSDPTRRTSPYDNLPKGPANQISGGGFDLSALLAGMGGGGASSFNGFQSLTAGNKDPYTPAQVPQYTPPDQSEYEKAALDTLKNSLGQSEWNSDRVAAMKEAQKEQALRMRADLNREVTNRFAGAGRSGSGAENALLRRGDSDTMSQILGAYRGVDENAAQNRRAEILSTVAALDGALSGQMNRGVSGYGASLAGAQGLGDEAYRGWQSKMQIEAAALQKAIAEESAKLDWRKTDQNGILALAQLMEQQRQFNEGTGLDWTKMNLGIGK